MKTRQLGQGLTVSAIGLGYMGMSEFYGERDEGEAISTLHRALDLGVTFIDTADMYGPFTNEKLVSRAIKDRREQVILATKFGNVRTADGGWGGVNGSPDYVKQCCEASLESDRAGQRGDPGSARDRVVAGSGRRHRAYSWHEAAQVSGGKRCRYRSWAYSRGARAD